MTRLKEHIELIHSRTDFKINFAGITKLDEFNYTHGGSVQPGLSYHAHYTVDKKEYFMTEGNHNSNSKVIIKKQPDSLFSKYSESTTPLNKTPYPKKHHPNPSEEDYGRGFIDRYFCQLANDKNSELFEISKIDFENQNSLYRYFSLTWLISGDRTSIGRANRNTVLGLVLDEGNQNLGKLLFSLQFFRPIENSRDDLVQKLQRRKKN